MAKAASRSAAFHLWFHPPDPASLFERELCEILQYIDRQRREGLVWVAPMAEIASYCEARQRLRPEVQRMNGEMTIIWRGSFPSERYGHTELSIVLPPLPSPRSIALTNEDGSANQKLGSSYVRTAEGRLRVNMPTSAKS